ncbi:MAG: hypothetical protein DWQ07_13670 [Chloroflexi bacterium]|nr:MAG: hypothetical protein DWQ07_13670 [Chloroflexota bacterium]MBL1197408.1 hypothetical protein [Chloroflexota bacterium]NOH14704.1 hypothetical protein [Chloroflexota bacterium]
MEENQNWKSQTLIAGAVIGALAGVGAAYLLVKRAEDHDQPPQLSAREGVSLGLMVLGLLRQVAQLGD